jgi:serine/threonine protein kinase
MERSEFRLGTRPEQRDHCRVAGSNPDLEVAEASECLSTDDVLAHLDRRLEGTRLQSVGDHLDACSACRIVMAEAARLATTGDGAPRTPRTLADGENVAGRYDIRRFIARGGMGEVYEAFDTALREMIALKTLIITAVDQTDAVKRLLAEVRIARKVTHPNVCRILEFGTHKRTGSIDDAVPFLTMPLLHGETLARRIERTGRLAPAEALRILGDLTAGLTAVHAAGVVHRDFKSDNVFLVRGDDGGERAVVMDFGLARALEPSGQGNKSTGRLLLGTPAYMAPEQVEGKAITKAVDVYALGVVAFELVTGRVPFVAETAAAVALARLQRAVPPPSSLVAGLDKRWDGMIQRCLKRVPEQRFEGMADLASALNQLRSGTRRRSWRFPAALAAGAAAVALATWAIASRTTPTSAAVVSQPPAAAVSIPASKRTLAPFPPAAPIKRSPPKSAKQQGARRAEHKSVASISVSRTAPDVPATASPPLPPPSALFERPSRPRPRQSDDLVDPF